MFRLEILNLLFISLCMVSPKVLFLVLFCLFCTLLLLSTIIFKSSVHHHLYADENRLSNSFSSNKFCENVSLLESAIAEVASWMSQNFLMLNHSKTEFLITGPPKQLSKIQNLLSP
jgi:hypothetical protein